MSPIESLAWAILTMEGFKPGTKAWGHNNPGNLRISKLALRIEEGYAVFLDFSEGWAALVADLKAKFRGAPYTRSGLGPDSTLGDLIKVWAPASDSNNPIGYAAFVSTFLTRALGRPIRPDTHLKDLQT